MTETSVSPPVITCGICFGILHEPVTLSCKHNFCSSCVLGRLECSKKAELLCLLCSATHGDITSKTVAHLADAHLRAYVRSRVEGHRGTPVCQWCQEVRATKRCQQCVAVYCADCSVAVHKNAAKRTHTTAQLTDGEGAHAVWKWCAVQGHEEYKLDFYCKTCESLCCAYCLLLGPHNNHESAYVSEAAALFRNRFSGEVGLLAHKKEQLEKKVKEVNVVTTRYLDSFDEVRKAIKDRCKQLRKIVAHRESELLEALTSLYNAGNGSLTQSRRKLLDRANAINESFALTQRMQRGCTDYEVLENRSHFSQHLFEEGPHVEGLGFKFFEVGDFCLPQFKLFLDLKTDDSSKLTVKGDTSLRKCIPHPACDDENRPQSGKVLNVCSLDGSMIPLRTGRRFTLTERDGVELKTVNSLVYVTATPNDEDDSRQVGIRGEQTMEDISRLHPEDRGRVTWRVQLGKAFDRSFVGVVERSDTSLVPGGFYWKPTKLGVVEGGIGKVGSSFKELPVCCIGDVLTFTYSVDEGSLGININGKYYGNLVTNLHPRISPCFILYPKESLIVSC